MWPQDPQTPFVLRLQATQLALSRRVQEVTSKNLVAESQQLGASLHEADSGCALHEALDIILRAGRETLNHLTREGRADHSGPRQQSGKFHTRRSERPESRLKEGRDTAGIPGECLALGPRFLIQIGDELRGEFEVTASDVVEFHQRVFLKANLEAELLQYKAESLPVDEFHLPSGRAAGTDEPFELGRRGDILVPLRVDEEHREVIM